jgi:hypothetical protein
MGDIAVENIYFIHRRDDRQHEDGGRFLQTDATESRMSTSKDKVKGKVRKQWRNECNIRYRGRDREGF